MTNSSLIVYKKQTDAISTNQGFYYQYLTTLKLWIANYVTKKNIDIFCETEDDVFQINRSTNDATFTQVKCYTDGFSLNSVEIQKSLLNFFLLHLKYAGIYNGEYIFETNADIKPRDNEIIDELIKFQITKNNEAYVFILKVLPKIKFISKTMILEIITNSILIAITNLDTNTINADHDYNKPHEISLSERIMEKIEVLASDNSFNKIIEQSMNDLYPIVKDDDKSLVNYIIFFNELGVTMISKVEEQIILKLPLEKDYIIKNNSYLFFLTEFIRSSYTFDKFCNYIKLFGSDLVFKDIQMCFHSYSRWTALFTVYINWQLGNIETIESNIGILKGIGFNTEKLFVDIPTYEYLRLQFEKIISFIPNIKIKEVKALVFFYLASENKTREISNDKVNKFTLEKFNTIATCNPYKEIIEYLIFTKDSKQNKIKRIESETGIKVKLNTLQI